MGQDKQLVAFPAAWGFRSFLKRSMSRGKRRSMVRGRPRAVSDQERRLRDQPQEEVYIMAGISE